MKYYIKKYENPSGNVQKLNNAIDEAYDFYHNDVEARKGRERSWLQQLYTIKTPIEKTSINIGNNQGIGLGTSSGDDFVGEWRYNKGIYLNPNIIFKKYYNKDRLSRAITHELSHEDAYQKRPKDYAIDEYIAPLVQENITNKEKDYLNNAYKTSSNTSSENIEEKHATNRQLRHQLYQNFIKVNGRKPDSIEELDDFIRNTSDMSIMYLLRDQNDYGNDYFYNKNTDPKAVKDALIHVAQNNTGVVQYAKKGIQIKKCEYGTVFNRNATIKDVIENNKALAGEKVIVINQGKKMGSITLPKSMTNDQAAGRVPIYHGEEYTYYMNGDGTVEQIKTFEYKSGGSIHIKEKNKGKFTESAKRAGKSVQEHARDVVNNPKATKLQKKRAQFALNAKKWKH